MRYAKIFSTGVLILFLCCNAGAVSFLNKTAQDNLVSEDDPFSIVENHQEQRFRQIDSEKENVNASDDFQNNFIHHIFVSDLNQHIRNTQFAIPAYGDREERKKNAPDSHSDSGEQMQIAPNNGNSENILSHTQMNKNHMEETLSSGMSDAMRYDSGFTEKKTEQTATVTGLDSQTGPEIQGSWYVQDISLNPDQEKAIEDAIRTIDSFSTKTLSLVGTLIENLRALRNPVFLLFGILIGLIILIKR